MAQYNSVFDIIGPIMIGPSSSHTAGAVRIGSVARRIFGELPEEVDILLYESFAKTYRGHGTDIALVGGLLGMKPQDEQLASSLKIAYEKGMEVCFVPQKEKADHPNTVTLVLKKGSRKMTVTGVSVGGGSIIISQINGFKVNMNLSTPTILIVHQDRPGMISKVTTILSRHEINIATMTVSRESKGEKAMMLLEVDWQNVSDQNVMAEIQGIQDVYSASLFI